MQTPSKQYAMNKKTTSIIALVATTILCGLPGLAGLCMSSLAILGALLPDSSVAQNEVILVVASSATIAGLSLLCLVVPIGIGLWSWASGKTSTIKPKTNTLEEIVIPEDDF